MDWQEDDEAGFVVARADWTKDEAAIRRIREAVFVEEQGIPPELEWDGADEECAHFLAYALDGTPIATARLTQEGQIGRMAVLPEWRGRGVGSALLVELMALAEALGLEMVFLNAQCGSAAFYHRHGFLPHGEPFEVAGLLHVRLYRYLSDPEDPPEFLL
ncbi:MAG: GNAT family N-acetyltransferase [Gammaproteobacteria bacterium]|nr:MAG: GNAT family N-acetyltransferase [Gammaproteobacteria bacterium]